jgi:type II secretory pathway component HofQ
MRCQLESGPLTSGALVVGLLLVVLTPITVTGQTESTQAQDDSEKETTETRKGKVIKGKGIELYLHEPADQAGDSKPDPWAAIVVSSEGKRFTGERISIVLKDAEIKDVLKTFATLTNLNIVVDPKVTGKVTLELHDVPWDQVIDLILKMNGYTYTIGERVIIVHPNK